MIDLVKWLERQLDEDERIARATMLTSTDKGEWTVTADPRSGDDKPTGVLGTCIHIGMIGGNGDLDEVCQAEHIVRFNPARVLREVEAKRKVLSAYAADAELRPEGWWGSEAETHLEGRLEARREAVLAIASVYSDRPGFKEEWRIEP